MKIKIIKDKNHLYRECIFCDAYMKVVLSPKYNDNELHSVSICKKCLSKIDITTHRNNYIIIEANTKTEIPIDTNDNV